MTAGAAIAGFGQLIVGLVGSARASKAAKAQAAIAAQQLYEAEFYRKIWNDFYRQCETDHAEDICSREVDKPRYRTTRNRLLVESRMAFSRARKDMERCASTLCIGSTFFARNQLAIAEANAQVEMSDRAFRFEENRIILQRQQLDDLLYRTHQLGRSMIVSASDASTLAAAQIGNIAGGAGALAGYGLSRGMRSIGTAINQYQSAQQAPGTNVNINQSAGSPATQPVINNTYQDGGGYYESSPMVTPSVIDASQEYVESIDYSP